MKLTGHGFLDVIQHLRLALAAALAHAFAVDLVTFGAGTIASMAKVLGAHGNVLVELFRVSIGLVLWWALLVGLWLSTSVVLLRRVKTPIVSPAVALLLPTVAACASRWSVGSSLPRMGVVTVFWETWEPEDFEISHLNASVACLLVVWSLPFGLAWSRACRRSG